MKKRSKRYHRFHGITRHMLNVMPKLVLTDNPRLSDIEEGCLVYGFNLKDILKAREEYLAAKDALRFNRFNDGSLQDRMAWLRSRIIMIENFERG